MGTLLRPSLLWEAMEWIDCYSSGEILSVLVVG